MVVILVSLEDQAPVQSASPESPAAAAPNRAAPGSRPRSQETDAPPAAPAPETFTFYDTLEQRSAPSPGLIEKPSRPADRPPSPSTTPSGKIVIVPKTKAIQYTIQVAAVKDRATAEGLTKRLKQKGYPVFTLPYEIPKKGTWYRVRVGHFSKREAAEEMAKQLSERERLTPYIAKE
jgi:DedD protein